MVDFFKTFYSGKNQMSTTEIKRCYALFKENKIWSDDENEFKRNFREYAKRNHPDKGGNTELFGLVSACRDILKTDFEKFKSTATTERQEGPKQHTETKPAHEQQKRAKEGKYRSKKELFESVRCGEGKGGWSLVHLHLFCMELGINYKVNDSKAVLCRLITQEFERISQRNEELKKAKAQQEANKIRREQKLAEWRRKREQRNEDARKHREELLRKERDAREEQFRKDAVEAMRIRMYKMNEEDKKHRDEVLQKERKYREELKQLKAAREEQFRKQLVELEKQKEENDETIRLETNQQSRMNNLQHLRFKRYIEPEEESIRKKMKLFHVFTNPEKYV